MTNNYLNASFRKIKSLKGFSFINTAGISVTIFVLICQDIKFAAATTVESLKYE